MNQQLSLDLGVIETKDSSITDAVIEPKMQYIYRFLGVPAKNIECSVNEYESSRCRRIYYRVSWRDGHKIRHLHIPGGSTFSELARYRAAQLQEMIARGAELAEIIAAVETYRGIKR